MWTGTVDVELSVKENGHGMSAGMLSEGTLQMTDLPALVGNGESPSLIAPKDPEIGIHPGIIDLIASVLLIRAYSDETQYAVTTRSLLLTDLVPSRYWSP